MGGNEISLQSNQTIPHHYIVQGSLESSDDRNWISALGKGMLLFARQSNGATPRGAPSGAVYRGGIRGHSDPNTAMLLEWTQLAVWLKKWGHMYSTPEQIMSEWKLAGVLQVEVAPNTDRNYGSRSAQRMLNLTVGQRTNTFNIWGSAVMEGTPLYLIVKKEPQDQILLSADDAGYAAPSVGLKRTRDGNKTDSEVPPSVEEIREYNWKFIPYADKCCPRPPLSAMSYYDVEQGVNGPQAVLKIGTLIYVGMASSTPHTSQLYGARVGLQNSNERITLFTRGLLPMVEVYMGV